MDQLGYTVDLSIVERGIVTCTCMLWYGISMLTMGCQI